MNTIEKVHLKEERLSDIQLTADEKNRLLVEWNDTYADFDKGAFIHTLFEAQAMKTPNKIAAVFEDNLLSFEALNERANRLAHYLQKQGLKPGMLIGLCINRSMEMLVAVLGILKAGGAYVPMDPAYPRERLAFMLEDSDMQMLLTEAEHLEWLPVENIKVICIDRDTELILRESGENLDCGENPGDLAYVIYTSGSTGRPKGVQISHRNVVNFLYSMKHAPGITDKDTLLALTSLSFDIAGLEIYLPLITGAKLVIAGRETVGDSTRLAAYIENAGVTIMQATPATWRMLLDAGWKNEGHIKILCGGEALTEELAQRLSADGTELWNMYGPTETTIWSAIHRVKGSETGIIPIGKPIANTKLYIVDPEMQPVSIGTAGELCIGGEGVSQRGYLNRPELTQEKFVADPFIQDGSLIYKTGDLVKYLPDGIIEYLGRIDNQVKIRGFRIELGEIENILLQHPSIKEAAVAAKDDPHGGKRLAAYIVPHKGETLTVGEMQAYLKNQLPEYMIPSWFMLMPSLPLTPNGKIDRLALPEPDNMRPELSTEYAAPSTEIEMTLAQIWSELLGVKQIGIDDYFFELGGHSLVATQVVSRIREVYGIELPIYNVFKYPTVRTMAEVLQNADRSTFALPPVERISRDLEIPLSFSQERIWFMEQLSVGIMAYYFQASLRMRGDLNIPVLEQSLTEIIRRQEIYRTTFPSAEGRPYQHIHEPHPVHLPVIDLTGIVPELREAEAQRVMKEEMAKPFDLTKLPLVRWVVLRLDMQDHILLHIEHHIVHDGWSFRVFLRDLFMVYNAYLEEKPSPLPELPVQFADFSCWQRRLMQGEAAARQLEYWVTRLSGTKGMLELPTDRPRPSVPAYTGSSIRKVLPESLCESVRALCRKENVTLFMVLMAAYKTLVHRYTGQEDIVVGSGIANRRAKESEGLYGMIVNNLAFRTDFSQNPTFRDVLYQIRDEAIGAYENQDLPYDRVVDALQLERDMSRNPLFQVMFSFHDTKLADYEVPGLKTELTEVLSNGSAKFDKNIIIVPHSEIPTALRDGKNPKELTMLWEYNSDLFDEDTVDRMMIHYIEVLKQAINHVEAPVSHLELLTPEEKSTIIYEWNQTEADYPKDKCLHHLFEEQAARTPKNTAVIYGDKQLSYAELDAQSNHLAHYLRSLGVDSNIPVGICVERSLEMVTALMGILKAGGAYVPIDTDVPVARKQQILEDAGAFVCISQAHLEEGLPTDDAFSFVYMDADCDKIKSFPDSPVQAELPSSNMISVYYTSGSTGKPKGVCSTHEGWVNRMVWMQDQYGLTAEETVLHKTTLTFDDSAVEIFWPLIAGARIAMLEPKLHKDPQGILNTAIKYDAAVLHFVPSMLSLFVEAVTPEDTKKLKSLKHVISSGEALRPELVKAFMDRLPGVSLNNQWGATEVSIDSTIYTCTPADTHGNGIVSVGRPISNNQVYILDKHLQPVPVGVAGDLYLGGVGLATGYLNRPDLTAEAFIPNPFVPGTVIYKTGDRGRYLPNGLILFLGRKDEQIKIRGQRVELGEIESVLATHPKIQDCAVVAHKRQGGYRLTAYYVKRASDKDASCELTTEVLQGYMLKLLPDYMVPGRFIEMESFPVTSSGKIDRKLLPEPKDERPDLVQQYVEAVTPTEKAIAKTWQEILEIGKVGIRDNFFELGGHSLDATRIISRINKELDVKLPLRVLFETLTVEKLAAKVDVAKAERKAEAAPSLQNAPIPRLEKQEAYELSNAQKRFFFQYQFDPQNAFGFTYVDSIEGNLDKDIFIRALKGLVIRHGIFRTTFEEHGGVPYQIIHEGMDIPCPYADISGKSKAEQDEALYRKISTEMTTPFDLAKGPLFRMALYKLSSDKHILVRSVHPISYDSWSTTVFMKDLSALYKAYKHNGGLQDLAPALQYVDFASWQRQLLTSGELKGQRDYWYSQLSEIGEKAELPGDPDVQADAYEPMMVQTPVFGRELTAKLHDFSTAQGVTVYLMLLAALKAWVSLVTNKKDIFICCPISGRTHPDLEAVLGLLVNPVVLRTKLNGNPTCIQIVDRVKQVAMDAYTNQDYPFDLVVQDIRSANGDNTSMYSIVFVGQNAHDGFVELDEMVHFHRHHDIETFLKGKKADDSSAGDDPNGQLDLHIEMFEAKDEISFRIQYNPAKYTIAAVERLFKQYEFIVKQFIEEPETRLSQLKLQDGEDIDELFA